MSTNLSLTAYASKESPEFKKHFKAVLFCIENELSFPKETSEFFKGKIGGNNLEDIRNDAILQYIENGVSVNMPCKTYSDSIEIKVSEIPPEVDLIIVELV